MAKASFPENDPQFFNIQLQYIPEEDLFYINGSRSYLGKFVCVDGYEASKRLELYLDQLMHEIEIIKRIQRDKRIAEETAKCSPL